MYKQNSKPTGIKQLHPKGKEQDMAALKMMVEVKTFCMRMATEIKTPHGMVAQVTNILYEWMTSNYSSVETNISNFFKIKMFALETTAMKHDKETVQELLKAADNINEWLFQATEDERGKEEVSPYLLNYKTYAIRTAMPHVENAKELLEMAVQIQSFLITLGDSFGLKGDPMLDIKTYCFDMAIKAGQGKFSEHTHKTCKELYEWVTRQGEYKQDESVKVELANKRNSLILPKQFNLKQ